MIEGFSITARRTRLKVKGAAVVVGVLSLLMLGCDQTDQRIGRTDCATWAGIRYCFPATVLNGFGSDAEQMSGIVYVPLTAPVLRKCNATYIELTRPVADYDNVDLLLMSLWKGQTSDWLYETIIQNQIGKVPSGWRKFSTPKCHKNRPGANAGVTCIEHEQTTDEIHVTSCDPANLDGVPGCLDSYIKNRVHRQMHYQRGCYPNRAAMRARVNAYIQNHSRN